MEPVTAIVALVATVLALRGTTGRALGILVATTLLWPEYLRIPIGPVQMSAPRFVALALLAAAIVGRGNKRYRFSAPDGAVVFLYVWVVFAQITAGAPLSAVSTYIGLGFDTALMYFVARVCIQTRVDLVNASTTIAMTCLIVGSLGFVEMLTMWSPWQTFFGYRDFTWIQGDSPRLRFGLLRAKGSMAVYIYFGLSMAMLFSILYSVRTSHTSKTWSQRRILSLGLIGAALGVASSLSSGPWLMLGMFIALFVFYRSPRMIRPAIFLGLIVVILVEIISNRHFYHLIDYVSLDRATAWYRARLLEVAFENLGEWWLLGVGSKPLLHWAAAIDGRGHLDIVNHYIWVGVSGGIPAVLALLYIQVKVVRNAVQFWKNTEPKFDRIGFSVAAITISIIFAMNTVSFFGPSIIFSYILYGILPAFRSREDWDPSDGRDIDCRRPI